jgi:hypothetical protein
VTELYIAALRSTAYLTHCAKANLLSGDQLSNVLLLEHHTKDEWVRLLHSLNTQGRMDPMNWWSQNWDMDLQMYWVKLLWPSCLVTNESSRLNVWLCLPRTLNQPSFSVAESQT